MHKKDERGSFHALWLVGFDPWLAGEQTLIWKEGIILWYMAQKPKFFSFKQYLMTFVNTYQSLKLIRNICLYALSLEGYIHPD